MSSAGTNTVARRFAGSLPGRITTQAAPEIRRHEAFRPFALSEVWEQDCQFPAIFQDENLRKQPLGFKRWKAIIAKVDGENIYQEQVFGLGPVWFPKIPE